MLGEHPDGSVTEIESRDAEFLEEEFPRRGEVDRNLGFYKINELEEDAQIPIEIKSDFIPSQSIPLNESVPLDTSSQDLQQCKSKRVSISHRHFEIENEAFMCTSQDEDEPKSYKEALSSPTSEKWKAAMIEEMESMKKNQVWDLVDLPPGQKTIRNKWVLKVKCKAEKFIERYKA